MDAFLSSSSSSADLTFQLSRKGVQIVIPCFPLLHSSSAAVEEDWLDEEEGCDLLLVTASARVGLSRRSTDAERILKFGTTEVAKRMLTLHRKKKDKADA